MDGGGLFLLLLVVLTLAYAPEDEAPGALLLRALQLGALALILLNLVLQLSPATSAVWPAGAALTAGAFLLALLTAFAPAWRDWLATRLRADRATYRPASLRHNGALLLFLLLVTDSLLRAREVGSQVNPYDLRELFMTASLLLMVSFLAVGYPLRRRWSQACARLGFRWPARRELLLASGVAVALMAFVSLIWLLWALVTWPLLAAGDAPQPEPGVLEALLAAALAALGEETLFRGALQPLFGVMWTSFCFALVHIRPGMEFVLLPLLAVSWAFAWLRLRHGTPAAICAHFCYNFALSLTAPLYVV